MDESSSQFGTGNGGVRLGRASRIEVETSESDGTALILVVGEIDLASASHLTEALEAVASSEPRTLVFDLGGVTFMDSTGLHVLVDATRRVGSVRLRRPSRQVQRILEVSGLGQLLPTES